MKCESVQKRILLAQSGELSWLGRRALSSHLIRCAGCRQFEDALNGITARVRGTELDASVSPPVLDRIRSVARRENSRSERVHIHPSREPFLVSFRPAFVYSAIGLMLLTGFWLSVRPFLNQSQPQAAQRQTSPAAGNDWDTAAIDTQIEDLSDRLDVAAVDEESAPAENEDVDAIARELLELEGQQI